MFTATKAESSRCFKSIKATLKCLTQCVVYTNASYRVKHNLFSMNIARIYIKCN